MKKCVYKKICKVYNRKKCSSKYSYENNNCSLVDIKIDKKVVKQISDKKKNKNNSKIFKKIDFFYIFLVLCFLSTLIFIFLNEHFLFVLYFLLVLYIFFMICKN